jgi:uncharacterized protein
MSKTLIQRPVWRRYAPRFLEEAAGYVRAGGFAAIVHAEREIEMLLGVDELGEPTEFALWAVLALEQQRTRVVTSGPAKGLRVARVGRHSLEAVLDWCERDSVHPGPTRRIRLDCLDCAACCHDSNVILYDDDLARFKEGGRPDLLTSKYIKRSRDGKVRLRFVSKGPCQHLKRDNKCAIYALRPFNCSVFPMGSEACLAARESTLSIRDGASAAT